MFGNAPAIEPAPEVTPRDELIPLSHFELDHPRPAEGWENHLGRRAIAFVPDDLGRDCVRRRDARRLLDEQRANELRVAKLRKAAELEAVEADAAWRASLPRGLQLSAIPEGATYGDVVRQTELDSLPRRRSMLEESLSGETLTFHSMQDEAS
jgi:hypothetical protein